MITANDPQRTSWIDVPAQSDFSIQNIPFGVGRLPGNRTVVCTRIGDTVIDLSTFFQQGHLDEIGIDRNVFDNLYLNDFIGLGKATTRAVRNRISDIFSDENHALKSDTTQLSAISSAIDEVEMLLPVQVGDYTDFYSSIEHATNVGTMFRDPNNALLPNWKHLPVGYHGRSSSIIPSGQAIHRPKGQTRPNPEAPPVYGPCQRLDFELEMAFITHQGKPLGQSITTAEADDYIFGMCIFNDWSARDIQTWEYVPLGPFLAKNFASSVSPWIVTLDALTPFRVSGPEQDPKVLPYLEYEGDKNIDIDLEVLIAPDGQEAHKICHSNYKHMYWNMNQQLAHQTVNGCDVNCGDLYASGTISGPTPDSYGSMLELAWKGTKPIPMPDGSERKFIHDHDTVIMRAYSTKNGVRVGFGEVSSKVLSAT